VRFDPSLRFRGRKVAVSSVALALVCYVPLLLTHRGKLGADTKTYLYINPGKLLSRAPFLWDPGVGLGTVTHQNIGYLWPMGPYYAVMDWIGVPDWIAQRLWMGTILFLAGMGVRKLMGVLRWDGPGIGLASFAYALSPYLLHYIYKHSVILLPFTALPWLIAYTVLALRRGGWRYPAAFALVTVTAGGVNATSLLLVLVGPLLWILHAWWIEKEVRWRAVLATCLRIGLLTAVTSVWWVAGLTLQGSNGIDILKYTETYKTVADAASSVEVFRSLGYWFFYGTDILGPWFKAAVTYTQSIPALGLSFLVPIIAVISSLLTRFRYQLFFVSLGVAGLVLSVGAHPWDDPSTYGAAFKSFTDTESGLAMRSTPRAIPLLALAVAVFLAAGLSVLTRLVPKWRWVMIGIAYALVIANLSPLWMGRLLDPYLERPNDVPAYWTAAGKRLDAGDRSTRAIEVPGIDFANYRWGSSVDPITPGLTDRDYSARELVPWGAPASADLTNALDAGFQDGSFDPAGYASLLRLAGVGDVVARNDLEYERYRTPRPRVMKNWLDRAGLGPVEGFGPSTPNTPSPERPLVDDTEVEIPASVPDPHKVEVRKVPNALPIVRTVPETNPVVMAGDAQGVVALANAGLLDPTRLLVYSGTVSNDEAAMQKLLASGADLVVTDTNRKAGLRWGAVRENQGYTEEANEKPKKDPTDDRLPVFPDRLDDTSIQTVSQQVGGWEVHANDYGNELTYTPGDRAALAVDGNPETAWKVGAFADVRGDWIQLDRKSGKPVTTDHIRLLQPTSNVNRWITKATLHFDHGPDETVMLDASSRSGTGQVVTFPKRSFTSVRITIDATDPGVQHSYRGISGVGFAEIDIDGNPTTEVIRPPTDLLDTVGAKADDHRVTWVLTRRRSNPSEAGLAPEELRMIREISSPTARTIAVSGTGRLDPALGDDAIDRILGVHDATQGGLTVTSSSRPAGDDFSRGAKAIDGDPTTAWQSAFSPQPGAWWQVTQPSPGALTVSSISVIDDRKHSLPGSIHLEVDGKAGPSIPITTAHGAGKDGAVHTYTFTPQTVLGTNVKVVVDSIVARTNNDWLSGNPTVMPLGIAELGITKADGSPLRPAPTPTDLPGTCRSDLATIGSTPASLALTGSTADAEQGRPLKLVACDASTAGVALPEGNTRVVTADGTTTGVDVNQLVLDAAPVSTSTTPPPPTAASGPKLTTTRTSRVAYDIKAEGSKSPYWLVLGQSINDGWHLTANGKDLGAPTLVNGFANGWRIDPAKVGTDALDLRLEWTPQRLVWIAIAISILGFLACLVLMLVPRFAGTPTVDEGRRPLRPLGISPFDHAGSAASVRTTVIACIGVFVGTAIFVTPVWAIVVAALCALALRTKWGWTALRVVTVGLLVVTAGYVVLKQWRNGIKVDFDWPQQFETVTWLPMVAFACLATDMVVEAIRGGWRRLTDDP
jgi:arabinofuranan 3-O-arabinosyltransferase